MTEWREAQSVTGTKATPAAATRVLGDGKRREATAGGVMQGGDGGARVAGEQMHGVGVLVDGDEGLVKKYEGYWVAWFRAWL